MDFLLIPIVVSVATNVYLFLKVKDLEEEAEDRSIIHASDLKLQREQSNADTGFLVQCRNVQISELQSEVNRLTTESVTATKLLQKKDENVKSISGQLEQVAKERNTLLLQLGVIRSQLEKKPKKAPKKIKIVKKGKR